MQLITQRSSSCVKRHRRPVRFRGTPPHVLSVIADGFAFTVLFLVTGPLSPTSHQEECCQLSSNAVPTTLKCTATPFYLGCKLFLNALPTARNVFFRISEKTGQFPKKKHFSKESEISK
jgi:hypothetical protein